MNIKPGSYPNSINLKSNGITPVAIFGSATFNVRQINPTTIKLANAPIKLKNNGQPMASYSDINQDLFIDVVIQVPTQALQLTSSDIKAKYNHQKNETEIKIKKENKKEIKQILYSLTIIKLITKSGVLSFEF